MNKYDKYLVMVVLFFIVLLMIINTIFAEEGKSVSISYDGEAFIEYDIDDDGIHDTGYGNVIWIENEIVKMDSASCPDELCIRQGEIKNIGESIICIPNKVIVEIIN